jgi:hypothetical protein
MGIVARFFHRALPHNDIVLTPETGQKVSIVGALDVTGAITASGGLSAGSSPTVANLTDSALTQHRVVVAGASGLLANNAALTATRVIFADANGELSSDADLTFVTDTLSATKIISSSLTASRAVYTDGSKQLVSAGAGASVTALTVITTITVVNGLVTVIA